ncbi:glycosyltransferase [Propioniciclava sinopodophylli]|uniref:Glycosyltransferase n=1 Tax=Propioniciclava sinopodophylli TaxID=1837344 RepID=A0A4Q9KBT5_9ACTN|nr:glycosyltransferase family 4 protein [Propioniciclava sinopodophylli]TBT83374.1 glycosyltransferase [Propioniciclava sinopodophylli]
MHAVLVRREVEVVVGWQDVLLLASTGWRMSREDPLWLTVQAARRFAPARRAALSTLAGDAGLGAAVGAFIADQPERTAALLRERGVSGTRWGDGLATRLAVQVGALDALEPKVAASPSVKQWVAQQEGDLQGAIAALSDKDTPASRKLRSEYRTLQPGFRLPVPAVDWDGPAEGIRVLHILTNSLPHTRSGYTNRTHHLLRASQAAGITVEGVTRIGYPTTVGLLGAAERDVIDGVTYRRLRTGRLARDVDDRLTQQVNALIPIARDFRPSILHTTTDYTNALVTQALAAALGIPWVYEMRGQLELTWVAARPEVYREAATISERVRWLRAKEAELASAADAVVALSQVQADDLAARGVEGRRIAIVPNAIDPNLLRHELPPADARRGLGLPAEGVWVGTVSSLVAYEGIDDLLRAVALLRAEGLDVRALIVGDGVARPGLIALADALKLADVAVFPGRVTTDAAARWYQALDIFAVPRKDTPVCRVVTPMKPVEAMALARPVVASDLPALREVLADRLAGALSEPENPASLAHSLAGLVKDPVRRGKSGQVGREAVRMRTWEAGAGTLLRTYEQLRG